MVDNKESEKFENSEQHDKKHQQFDLIYSPRTTYANELDYQEVLFNDLTLNFDPITIKIIKKHFKERLGSLDIVQFISILKNHLLSWHPNLPNREKKLMRLLHRLFKEIDLNDNGDMEWAEFCNYIIHTNNASQNASGNTENGSFKNKIYSVSKQILDTKEYIETISQMFYIEKLGLFGIIGEGKSEIIFYDSETYKKVKAVIDIKDIQRDLDILEDKELDEKMRILAKEKMRKFSNDPFGLNKQNNADEESEEEVNNNIHKRGNKNKEKKKKFVKDEINLFNASKKVSIICTHFITCHDLLMISQSNKRITAWKFVGSDFVNDNNLKNSSNEGNKLIKSTEIFFTALPQYCMTWDSINKNFYTAQEDGKIFKWELNKPQPIGVLDLETTKGKSEIEVMNKKKKNSVFANEINNKNKGNKVDAIKKINKKKQYETRDFVTSLLIITKIQVLASSYLNGKIILWDTLLMNRRKQYKNKLETGVYRLEYDSNKNLLFACGFDSKIMVYDPYIESEIYELEGHMVSIANILVNEKENELISYDINGNIKIWDTKNFNCTQTLTPYEGQYSMSNTTNKKSNYKTKSDIVLNSKSKKILCFRKHEVKIYEVDRSLNPNLCDDQMVCSSFYDKLSKIFITVCLRKIKMWNPFNGKISRIYDDPMKAEITALVLDPAFKRIFLGDNSGNIKCFNMKNGSFLKDLDNHDNCEISILLHSQHLLIVISASIDNIIKIHDDKELTESSLIKKLEVHTYNIKSLALMDNISRLVIGLSSGICKFYDIEHFRYDSDIHSEIGNVLDEVTSLYQFNHICPKFTNDPEYKERIREERMKNKDKLDEEENENSHNYKLILSAHSSGKVKLMFTPPYILKFNVVYEFVHLNVAEDDFDLMKGKKKNDALDNADIELKPDAEDEDLDFGNHTPILFMDFDAYSFRLFAGDQIGRLRCYDFSNVFRHIDEHLKQPDPRNKYFLNEIYNYKTGKGRIKTKTLWYVDAHHESIKHLFFAETHPKIIISTSHDLKVKLFNAKNGTFIDELKQGANKYPPVPIGIKYKGVDPITSKLN